MSLILIVTVLPTVIRSVAFGLEGNIGEFHFTIPEIRGSFSDAVSWCKANNSTLVVVNDSFTQTSLAQFLDSSHATSVMYINARLHQNSSYTWFLLNGSRFNGNIGNQEYGFINYRLYCCLTSYANDTLVDASSPSNGRNYICNYEGSKCSSDSANSVVYSGRCFVKYDDENLTWYQARERCTNMGGDLATFQNNQPNMWISPFNTSWLNRSLTYWVGIRFDNLLWTSSDSNLELLFPGWSIGKPNNYNYSCVCVDPNGSPSWSWADCDCAAQRQFVCVKVVPTTSTVTTSKTSLAIPLHATTSQALVDYNRTSCSNGKEALIVGLVLGIGVILPLLVIILLLVVVNIRQRRQQREKSSSNEGVNHFVKATSAMETNGSTEAASSDAHYQHLKRDERPGTQMPLYDQLDQTQAQEYERVP